MIQGLITATFGVPSFVVTLGGLIGWQGLQLSLLGDTGAMNINDPVITGLTRTFFQSALGCVALVILAALMMALTLQQGARRAALRLETPPMWLDLVRIAIPGRDLGSRSIHFLGSNRGIPLSAILLLGLVALVDFVCRRTVFGRRLFAVGGDAIAAARVGIKARESQ